MPAIVLSFCLFTRTSKIWLAVVDLVGFAALILTCFGVIYLLSELHAYK